MVGSCCLVLFVISRELTTSLKLSFQSFSYGRSLGRLIFYFVPQPLQGVAVILGNGVAQVFNFTPLGGVLIPTILLSRTLMVLGLKLYVLLKLATFGVELCRLFSILISPWLKKGAQQVR